MTRVHWQEQPHARLFQVFNRRRRSLGTWDARRESTARAELAQHPGGYLLVLDEYYAKLPALGHQKLVVVDVIRRSA
jgi:hypothetical protein